MENATEINLTEAVESALIPVEEYMALSDRDMLVALYVSNQQLLETLTEIRDKVEPMFNEFRMSPIAKMLGL